jgi:hypothetical protein
MSSLPQTPSNSEEMTLGPSESRGSGVSSTVDDSTDQGWGELFDLNGKPTERLRQLLSEIANHIVRILSSELDHDTN